MIGVKETIKANNVAIIVTSISLRKDIIQSIKHSNDITRYMFNIIKLFSPSLNK